MSKLEELGLDQSLILEGEIIEFEPVKPKGFGEKREFYLKDQVDTVIEAYGHDLREALEEKEETALELEETRARLAEFEAAIGGYKESLDRLSAMDAEYRRLAAEMDKIEADKRRNLDQIQGLQSNLSDMQEAMNKAVEASNTLKADIAERDADRAALEAAKMELEIQNKEFEENVNALRIDVETVLEDLHALLVEYGITE